ncbi:PKD domain-containing protein [Candidatus Bathyarchaeota archaeon]|nr:PKD domain-containing protein [Candidatus Bathyarchaeota archaeon]
MKRTNLVRRSKKIIHTFLVMLLVSLAFRLPIPTCGSSGNILINATTFPSPDVIIQIGQNMSLYFGHVTWSGAQIKLYLSKDGYSSISSQTDIRFGPTFDIIKIMGNTIDATSYPGFTVGKNWINGTLPKTLEVWGGQCFVKALDGSSAAVAVTDKSFTILAILEVAPSYGPGKTTVELRGYSLPSNDYANLSYNAGNGWKPLANFVQANENGRLSYFTSAPDVAEVQSEGITAESFSKVTFKMTVNSTGQITNGTFNEYRRGVKQVYSPDSKNLTISEGRLIGNNTDLAFYNFFVRVKGDLTIVGQWFNPGTVTVLWDNTTLMGSVTADTNGFFTASVVVPITTEGNHTVTIRDSAVRFVLRVLCLSLSDTIPPVADAGPDLTVNEDTTMVFDGSGSSDNKGIVSYVWTFTDVVQKKLVGVSPEYVFENPGIYYVWLNVTDLGGNWNTDELVITVLDVTKPVPKVELNQIVNEDTIVTLDGSKSTDNVGVTSYTWTIFEDTTIVLIGSTVEHNFSKPGVYTIMLNVTDAAGNWGADVLNIKVLDITNPVAEAGSYQSVVEGAEVRFYAGMSRDNVGIVSYNWDFGDGTNSSGVAVSHVYSAPGEYVVVLTVFDKAGNRAVDSTVVTVLRDTDRDSTPDILDDDDDGDGMPDEWELRFRLNPTEPSDAHMDMDGDGLTNLQEFLGNTNPNDFFSPLTAWIIGVTLVPIIAVIAAIYIVSRTAKVSKEEYVEKEVAKFLQQFPDIQELNPGYYIWKLAEIRQEAEKQYEELTTTGYIITTRTSIRKRLAKALKKKQQK